MKIKYVLLAALCAPTMAMAQANQLNPTTPAMTAALERMRTNVAQITAPGEKGRWSANLAMWTLVLNKDSLTAADADSLNALLDVIRANVAEVSPSFEKQRWTQNVDLWDCFINETLRGKAKMPPAASIAKIANNVRGIAEPREKERWSANRDLWMAKVGTQP